jgi:hypothetical protein
MKETNPLGNLFGAIALVGTGFYLAKKSKPTSTILLGALGGGIGGYIIGLAIYKFYTYDKDYVITT